MKEKGKEEEEEEGGGEEEESEGRGEGQEAPYNWLTPDHPPLAAITGSNNKQ